MTTLLPWGRPHAALATALWPADVLPRIACRPTHLAPLAWIAVVAAALWPHGLWIARRDGDGSDDPLGLAALAVVLLLLLRTARTLRVLPATGWLALAGALTIAANVARWWAPPLLCSALAALALAAGLCAWWPAHAARGPIALLLLLALPLVASLQYYAGYPLRVLTAQASGWLLGAAGFVAERSGATLLVDGRLVIVDAPCSGVQMAWLGYFCACTAAALAGRRDASFVRRLPLVGVLVLGGNIVRNTLLVALESRPQGLDAALHEAIGLAALALVCVLVVRLMAGGRDATRA